MLVTGSSGLVGTSLVNKLKSGGYKKILTPSSKELDLRDQNKVNDYFKKNNIDYVFHLAAKVSGFKAKMSAPAEFLYDNLYISCNVIEASRIYKVKRLIYIGTACIYPVEATQPFKEDSFFFGKLEPVNEGYGLAKIIGLKLCGYCNEQYKTNFITLVPCNLYGPHDRFESNPHLIPSIIIKLHDAKKNNLPFVEIRSSGEVRREFLFVDDLADAILYFIKYRDIKQLRPFINIGYGNDISIKDVVLLIKEVVGYSGEIKFDELKQEEMPRRLLDSAKAKRLGWKPKTSLEGGLKKTYNWFLKNKY